ncbi:unnamed protein product [Miscanthus lutarioriparius]|uniref:Uncharacterized protein n=1 Tax=Miscanthus lutarioriparius TaxID=422564 RepID=A0A811PG11_9POAL|nr:unnamed protein product [Miscanthus lutarioriparius]
MVGCLATSTKTILAESLLHGYKFDSINTVYYMAPFATMILSVPAMVLEGSGVVSWPLHMRVGGASAGDHRHVGGAGLLPQLLHLLRDPLDDGRDVQRGRQPQGGRGGAGVVDDLPEPYLGMNAVGCAVTLVGCTFYSYVRHPHLAASGRRGDRRRRPAYAQRPLGMPLTAEKQGDKI